MNKHRTIEPGTSARLSAKFLRDTGQYSGRDANRTFVVQPCGCGLCKLGFCAVDDLLSDGTVRHVATPNLQPIR